MKEVEKWYESEMINEIFKVAKDPEGVNVAVVGDWGTGKTTFLRILQRKFESKGHFVVFYDAWRYQNDPDVLLSMLEVIKYQLKGEKDKKAQEISKQIDNLITYINKDVVVEKIQNAIEIFGRLKVDMGIIDALQKFGNVILPLITQNTFVNAIFSEVVGGLKHFPDLRTITTMRETKLQIHIYERLRDIFEELKKDDSKYLVLIVDDLDRLMPSKAIELLEDLRFYFYLDNVIVIMGVNERILVKYLTGLKIYNDEWDAQRFLEKIFNLRLYTRPATINSYHIKGLHRLIEDKCGKISEDDLIDFFSTILREGNTPLSIPHRIWIKFMNSLVPHLIDKNGIVSRIFKDYDPGSSTVVPFINSNSKNITDTKVNPNIRRLEILIVLSLIEVLYPVYYQSIRNIADYNDIVRKITEGKLGKSNVPNVDISKVIQNLRKELEALGTSNSIVSCLIKIFTATYSVKQMQQRTQQTQQLQQLQQLQKEEDHGSSDED